MVCGRARTCTGKVPAVLRPGNGEHVLGDESLSTCRLHIHTTLWLPIGHNMKKRKSLITHCPSCNHQDETEDHLLLCPGRDWGKVFVKRLDRFLLTLQTAADVRLAITRGVSCWLLGSCEHQCPTTMTTHYQQQTAIGWRLWFRGLHANSWSAAQDQAFDHLPRGDRKRRTLSGSPSGVRWPSVYLFR